MRLMPDMTATSDPIFRLPRLLRILSVAAVLVLPFPAQAQGLKAMLEALGGGEKAVTPEASPAAQMDWAKEQLASAEAAAQNEAAISERMEKAGIPATRIEDFRAANQEIQRNFQTAMDIMAPFASGEEAAPEKKPVPVPDSEKQASALRDALRRATMDQESSIGERELIRAFLAQNQALQANAEREARQFQEEMDLGQNPETRERAQLRLELAKVQARAAASAVFLGKWKLAQLDASGRKISAEAAALSAALRSGGFDRQIDARRADSQLAAVDAEIAASDKAAVAAAKELTKISGNTSKLREKNDSPQDKSRSIAADALEEAARKLSSALQGNAFLLADEKSHWTDVKGLALNMDASDLREAIAQSQEIIARQNDLRPTMERRQIEARESLENTEKQLLVGVSDPATKSLLEQTVTFNRERIETLGRLISKSRQIIATQQEFLSEAEALLARESTVRRIALAGENLIHRLGRIWSTELPGGEGLHITVGKIVLAVLGLLLAYLGAHKLSQWTTRAAVRRFQLVEDQRTLLEKSVFIPLVAIFVLTILHWLNIPITVFAFLGGALAIGIGFGAQNLMNNFISGILLLLERQIKVGDIIEVAGSTGKVTHLGSRCSRIRKFNGVELLVPNSAFLEKEVTNWTLADPHHRFDFTIGTAYGSPVDKVISLLESAIERQPEILRDPAPGVFFESFGDSSLVFRIYYWMELGGSADARQVGSELRCRIDRDFRAAGVEMPFPQRDLHLRSSTPIAVRFEQPEAKEPPETKEL